VAAFTHYCPVGFCKGDGRLRAHGAALTCSVCFVSVRNFKRETGEPIDATFRERQIEGDIIESERGVLLADKS
jgi:hypothetical protein